MTMQKNPVALIDLDGTLADYDAAMQRDLLTLCNADERVSVTQAADMHTLLKLGPHWGARMELIKRQPGWWRDLPRMESNFRIVDILRDLGFHLNILTKGPWSKAQAWAEKVEWCREHVPDAEIHITGSQTGKGLVYGRVLFDDWPLYVESWLKWRPRGLVIMPAHPWNETFKHPQVVRWDGTREKWLESEGRLKLLKKT